MTVCALPGCGSTFRQRAHRQRFCCRDHQLLARRYRGANPWLFDMRLRRAAALQESRALRLLVRAYGYLPPCRPLDDWPHTVAPWELT